VERASLICRCLTAIEADVIFESHARVQSSSLWERLTVSSLDRSHQSRRRSRLLHCFFFWKLRERKRIETTMNAFGWSNRSPCPLDDWSRDCGIKRAVLEHRVLPITDLLRLLDVYTFLRTGFCDRPNRLADRHSIHGRVTVAYAVWYTYARRLRSCVLDRCCMVRLLRNKSAWQLSVAYEINFIQTLP